MEISKQEPPISANSKTPFSTDEWCFISRDEWLENNKERVWNVKCVELKFDLNSDIRKQIFNAKTNISKKMDNLYLELKSFDMFGKTAIKEMKIHPDTFLQVAIQVAGYRTTGRYVYSYMK